MKTERNKGIDFLRILLMAFIIFHHAMLGGTVSLGDLETGSFNPDYSLFAFLNSFAVVSVNCFFIISGYFGIKKNYAKMIKLTGAIYLIFWGVHLILLLAKAETLSMDLIKGFVFPVRLYWYMLVYLILSFLAPYIEILLRNLSLKDEKLLCLVLFFVFGVYSFFTNAPTLGANNGYSLSCAVFLYITGNLLRKTERNLQKVVSLLLFLAACTINGIGVLFAVRAGAQSFAWKLFSYNNPLLILASTALFLSFKNTDNALIRKISGLGQYTLYIYIIQGTASVFPNFFNQYTSFFGFLGKTALKILLFSAIGSLIGCGYNALWIRVCDRYTKYKQQRKVHP